MTVAELIEILENFDPNMTVNMATQPNYPLEYAIDGIAEYCGKLYVCEGEPIGYTSEEIWDNIL